MEVEAVTSIHHDKMDEDGCTAQSPGASQTDECVIVEDGPSSRGKDSSNSKKETARKRPAGSPKGKRRNKAPSSSPSSKLIAQQNSLKTFLESAPTNKKPKLDSGNDVSRKLMVENEKKDGTSKEVEQSTSSISMKDAPVTPVRCEYLSGGNWLDARVVDTKIENEKRLLGIQLVYKAEDEKEATSLVWEEQCSEFVRYPDQAPVKFGDAECGSDIAIKQQDVSDKANGESGANSETLETKSSGGRQKAVARVKSTVPAKTNSNDDITLSDATNKQAAANSKQCSAVGKPAGKAKDIMPQEEREKREKLLREELLVLAALKAFSENIPMLRPTAEELVDLEDMKDIDGPLPIKIRQLIARFLEGRSEEGSDLNSTLKSFMEATEASKACLESLDFSKLDGLSTQLGDFVDCRPLYDVPATSVQLSIGDIESCSNTFVRRFEVRDMADIPEKFRAILDVHRKLEAGVKERMRHLLEMLKEVKIGGKNLVKMEKALVGMKDRYAKLEERERKEKEKLEAKLEADRKRIEEAKKKLEEAKKRQEEKDEKQRKKDEEAKGKEKKEQEKVKEVTVSKQASFMANFFKKPAGGASADPSKPTSSNAGFIASAGPISDGDKRCPTSAAAEKHVAEGQDSAAPPARAHRNFHPWEKPKNAIVAGFPYGPGNGPHRDSECPPPAEGADMMTWIAHWRRQRHERHRLEPAAKPVALRADGTPIPRMKMIQLAMQVPETRTQLVDVDVDAPKKVVWDVENDPKEEQLQTILGEAEQLPDGLYRWKGRILQFVKEGGGWFESRRPPYFGTWSKKPTVVSGRRPLAREAELDYEYESDADWESEAGEGEDLGSEMDVDEDNEEGDGDGDEDGGFVVPDGYSSDRDMPDAAPLGGPEPVRRPQGKLQPVVYDWTCMPAELGDALGVVTVDELPLVLSRDWNLAVEEDTDFFGEDIVSVRAASLEAALFKMHQHPTACSLTYILPGTESKYAGQAFLKTAAASQHRTAQVGMVSAYLRQVPNWKLAAIQAQHSAAAKEAAAVEQAAAAALAEIAAKSAPPAPVQVTEAQLQALIKLLHGSRRGKAELVEEYIAKNPGLSKKKADRIITQFASKKVGRWAISDETLAKHPSLSDLAAQAWAINFTATPTPPAPAATSGTSAPAAAASTPVAAAPAAPAPAATAVETPSAAAPAQSTPPKGPAQQRLHFRPVQKPAVAPAPASASAPAPAVAPAPPPAGVTAAPPLAAKGRAAGNRGDTAFARRRAPTAGVAAAGAVATAPSAAAETQCAGEVIVLEEYGCLPIPN